MSFEEISAIQADLSLKAFQSRAAETPIVNLCDSGLVI